MTSIDDFLHSTTVKAVLDVCADRVTSPFQTAPLAIPSQTQKSLSVSVETPLGHALRIMREKNAGAVAVYAMEEEDDDQDDEEGSDDEEIIQKPVYRGIVNIMDVLVYIVGSLTAGGKGNTEELPPVDPEALFEKCIGDLLGKTAESNASMYPGREVDPHAAHKGTIDSSQSLWDLGHEFASGAHWIFVQTSTSPTSSTSSSSLSSKKSMDLLSQFDLLYYLHTNRRVFSTVFNTVVQESMMQSLAEASSELSLSPSDPSYLAAAAAKITPRTISESSLPPQHATVVSAPQTTKALSVFQMMAERNVQVVALVDDDGVLVGELGALDLRWMGDVKPPPLADLRLPAVEFADRANRGRAAAARGNGKLGDRADSPSSSSSGSSAGDGAVEWHPSYATQYVTVGRHAALGEAVEKMVEQEVGRVWVVDETRKPIGIVTISDVITMLLPDGDD